MNIIVSKFGGSSVANAAQIQKVARIVKESEQRRVIVVSAPGKRSKEDDKITDILISCHKLASEGKDVTARFQLIRERYAEIAVNLGIEHDIDAVIDEVESNIKNGADANAVVSRGEYLGAHLIARYLGYQFLDAAEIIRFSDESTVDVEQTEKLVREKIDPAGTYVIPGFYGAYSDGTVQLFTRGGSDISAALVAAGIGASVYENWTDVSGLLSADPRVVDTPAPIPEVTYVELRELAYLGANVFHDEAVAPVASKDIPINIRNTNEPDHPGTRIVGTASGNPAEVTGVAGKTGFRGIYVEKPFLSKQPAFVTRLRDELVALGVRVDHLVNGGDSLLAVAGGDTVSGAEERIASMLIDKMGCHSVDMNRTLALVGAVGPNVAQKPAIMARLFAELQAAEVPVHFSASGYSPHSILVGVDEGNYQPAVRALYRGARG